MVAAKGFRHYDGWRDGRLLAFMTFFWSGSVAWPARE